MKVEPEYRPRLNHVAITMDPAALDDAGRAEILDFYGDVFGWTEGDNTGERGQPAHPLHGRVRAVHLPPAVRGRGAPGARSTTSVCRCRRARRSRTSSARAKKRQASDDRVTVTDIHSRTTHGPVHEYTLTSAYIGFVLPLTIELQNITRRDA